MTRARVLLVVAFVAATGARAACAQQSASFDLTWSRVAGGGVTFAASDGFRLGSTTGQHEAGGMGSEHFGLTGGFWPPPTSGAATAAAISLAEVCVTPGGVHIVWALGVPATAIRVERWSDGGGWIAVADVVPDATGRIAFAQGDLAPGRYGYRLAGASASGPIAGGETWVDVPAPALGVTLVGGRTGGPLTFRIALPAPGEAALELLDVSGRRLWRNDLGALSAGPHEVSPANRAPVPGVYLVALHHGGRTTMRKVVTTR